MNDLIRKVDDLIDPLRRLADAVGTPLLDLAFRLYLAWAFFVSGLNRFASWRNDDWDTQLFLFEYEHPVGSLDPGLAASVTTIAELVLPVLVALGFMARFGAIGLFVMALTIELTYQSSYQHLLWMALALSIFIRGPGPISLDHLLVSRARRPVPTGYGTTAGSSATR